MKPRSCYWIPLTQRDELLLLVQYDVHCIYLFCLKKILFTVLLKLKPLSRNKMGNKYNHICVLVSTGYRHLKHVKKRLKTPESASYMDPFQKSAGLQQKQKICTTCRTSDGAIECIYACLHAGKNSLIIEHVNFSEEFPNSLLLDQYIRTVLLTILSRGP